MEDAGFVVVVVVVPLSQVCLSGIRRRRRARRRMHDHVFVVRTLSSRKKDRKERR